MPRNGSNRVIKANILQTSPFEYSSLRCASAWGEGEVGVIIAELTQLLDRVIRTAKTSNLPQNTRSFTELEMAQIIAVLETALNMLKAPLVEKSLLKKAAENLSEVGRKTAQEKSEVALGKLADLAWKQIIKLALILASKNPF